MGLHRIDKRSWVFTSGPGSWFSNEGRTGSVSGEAIEENSDLVLDVVLVVIVVVVRIIVYVYRYYYYYICFDEWIQTWCVDSLGIPLDPETGFVC